MATTKEFRWAKADRLAATGAVARLAEGLWAVQGDHGCHLVAIVGDDAGRSPVVGTSGALPPRHSCTCTHGRSADETACSHVMAALRVERAARPPLEDPFAGLIEGEQ